MKFTLKILFFSLLFQGCLIGDNPMGSDRIEKSFCTSWFQDHSDLKLIESNTGEIGSNGSLVVGPTVVAVGSNSNFIIVKQYPQKKKEISDRRLANKHLLDRLNQKKYLNNNYKEYVYLLPELSDTVWLPETDYVFKIDSVWCHRDLVVEYNLPDILEPIKQIAYYYIIDIRHYDRLVSNSYSVFKIDNEHDFLQKRIELNVSDTLVFTIFNPDFM